MPLILRVDVDKPYGRATFTEKVLSKLSENYIFPNSDLLGYLDYLRVFLAFLSDEKIKAHFYFLQCTRPPKKWFDEGIIAGHKIGHHAENTRTFELFKQEIEEAQSYFGLEKITSFTKHGSGKWKSGRRHYPLYEPDKYRLWAESIGVPFLFGNEEIIDESGFDDKNQFYPGMVWVERLIGKDGTESFKWIINTARNRHVIIIIHPENFIASSHLNRSMKNLIILSRQENVPWITL